MEEQGLLNLRGILFAILGVFGLVVLALWPFYAIRNRFHSRVGRVQEQPKVWRLRRRVWAWGGVIWVVFIVLLILFQGRP